jgi:hypothetical protein
MMGAVPNSKALRHEDAGLLLSETGTQKSIHGNDWLGKQCCSTMLTVYAPGFSR